MRVKPERCGPVLGMPTSELDGHVLSGDHFPAVGLRLPGDIDSLELLLRTAQLPASRRRLRDTCAMPLLFEADLVGRR